MGAFRPSRSADRTAVRATFASCRPSRTLRCKSPKAGHQEKRVPAASGTKEHKNPKPVIQGGRGVCCYPACLPTRLLTGLSSVQDPFMHVCRPPTLHPDWSSLPSMGGLSLRFFLTGTLSRE